MNHFREYSHIYESGIFSYYRRDYIGAALCLLAAMEGILLSFCGWTLGNPDRKPTIPGLITRVRTAPLPYEEPTIAVLHNMYRDTFADFLSRWLYRPTSQSDFSLSVLNRHLVFHGLEPGNFYRPEDVHRLILAFDLLVEFLAVRQRVFYTFLPDPGKDIIFDKRGNYYYALASGAITAAESWKTEREMLKDHPNYVPPDQEPNLAESLATGAQQLVQLLKITGNPPTGSAGQS